MGHHHVYHITEQSKDLKKILNFQFSEWLSHWKSCDFYISNSGDIDFMSSQGLFPREVSNWTILRDKRVYMQSLPVENASFPLKRLMLDTIVMRCMAAYRF